MKKTITAITLAATLALGATFANAETGIIVAGTPVADNCQSSTDGIIVAGRAIVAATFGIIVAGTPVAQCVENDGIIVAG
jgi:hypothetical protein